MTSTAEEGYRSIRQPHRPPSKKSLLKYTSVTTDDAAYLLDIAVIDADPHSSLGMIQECRVVCAIVVQDSNKIQRRSMNRLLWHFIKQLSSTTAKLCLVSLAFSIVTPGDVVLLEMWTKLEQGPHVLKNVQDHWSKFLLTGTTILNIHAIRVWCMTKNLLLFVTWAQSWYSTYKPHCWIYKSWS